MKTTIQKRLFELRDEQFRDFNSSLLPTVDKEKIIGVRTPELKKLARELFGTKTADDFIASLPHQYFEENQLHAFLICEEKNFEKCLLMVKSFLPFIDNWATCDQLSPKVFYKNPEKLLFEIARWCDSGNTYEIRFGIEALMRYFLDESFKTEYAERVLKIKSEEYYIKMMIAWYFATALAKQWESVFPIIKEKRLDNWTHNKAIQKSIESRRIPDDKKTILKALRV